MRWWANNPAERFWLESTDRADIGADLRAPLRDASERENWRYTLFREAQIGDVVFHYDGRDANAIVGCSRVAGPPTPATISWKPRGSYARERGDVRSDHEGYIISLRDYERLPTPLTLARLRAESKAIKDLVNGLKSDRRLKLYFPFELSDKRELRPMQGYAFKLPAGFVSAFAELSVVTPQGIFRFGDAGLSAEEWRTRRAEHIRKERSPELAREKKRQVLSQSGRLECEACLFDFEKAYGARGRGYIEAHHRRPLHTLREGDVTTLDDLALICANCHRLIHSRQPWLTVEELSQLVTQRRLPTE